jgi:uncharacterized protein (TIGR00255 family)
MRSMTGFGRGVVTDAAGTLTAEIKSVNHRYCQVAIRLPHVLSDLEPQAVATLKTWAGRGHLTVGVEFVPQGAAMSEVRLDLPLAMRVAEQLRVLRAALGVEEPVSLAQVAQFPDVLRVESARWSSEERWPGLEACLADAWKSVLRMREMEGEALREEMAARLEEVRSLHDQIAARIPDLVALYRERLAKRLRELLSNGQQFDDTRVLIEAGLLADRADVSEELSRLESHTGQFAALLAGEEPSGRQMDFLLQEMNREANTIGAKAPQSEVVALCVALKTEIERLREQAQNVE